MLPEAAVYGLFALVFLCGIGSGYSLRGMMERKRRGEPMFPLPSSKRTQ